MGVLTIVLIAHRFTTLQGCDIIYLLDQGNVVSAGGYDELFTVPNTTLDEKYTSHAG